MTFDGVEGCTYSDDEPVAGICELDDMQTDRLQRLLDELIPSGKPKLGLTHLTTHSIDVQGAKPIKQRYYPVLPKVREEMYQIIDKPLEEGVIEPLNSAWSSPVVMHLKPDGTRRACIDFRKINKLTKKDAYPLPNMNEILSKLRNARYISTLDLSQAYFQVPLDGNSKEYTAFTIPGRGLYQFMRLPYGLSNSRATFQRLIDGIITSEMDGRVYCYVDDIVIVSETFEEHLHWLRIVITRLKQAT